MMWMALSLFPLAATFFLFGGIYMIPSVILVDQCPVLTDFGHNVIDAMNMSLNIPYFNLTRPFTAADAYDYYTICEGQQTPEVLDLLQDPGKMINDRGFNFTSIMQKVTSSATNSTNFQLHPHVLGIFNEIGNIANDAIGVVLEVHDQLLCDQFTPAWQQLYSSICVAFTRSIAATCIVFILMGCCTCPGIIVGIRGYKHLNEEFVGDPDVTTDFDGAPEDGQEFDENPLADGDTAATDKTAKPVAEEGANTTASAPSAKYKGPSTDDVNVTPGGFDENGQPIK